MIKQAAKVIAENDTSYLLETLPKSNCPRCASGKGCGGGLLTEAFSNKVFRVAVNKSITLNINDLVQIGINSSVLVKTSFIVYFQPLILMICGAFIAQMLYSTSDRYTVTGATIGIIVGLFVTKLFSKHYFNAQTIAPVLIGDDDRCLYENN